MKNLIRAEFFYLKKSAAYKAVFTIYVILEIIVIVNDISNSIVYPKYNPVYTGMGWLSDYPETLLAYVAVFLFIAFYVNGDFTARTFDSEHLCGMPRKNAFWAKMISLFAGVMLLMLVHPLMGMLLWSVHAGLGMGGGAEVFFVIVKVFARLILESLMLVSHAVLFAVIAKGKISAFALGFGTLFGFGVLRGNIPYIVPIPALRESLLFVLSLFSLNIETFLLGVCIKLLAARNIIKRREHLSPGRMLIWKSTAGISAGLSGRMVQGRRR